MNRCYKFLPQWIAALVVAAIIGAPTKAHATFELSWSANTSFLGNDPTNTSFGISASAPGFTISGSAVGTNSGAFPVGTVGMDLSTISITSTGPSTLTLYLTQNGLTSPLGTGTLSETLSGHFLSGSGTATMVAYGNDTNGLYGNATGQTAPPPPTGGLTNVSTGPVSLSLLGTTASTTFTATNPYSITEIITINFTSTGTVSLSSDGSTTFSSPAPTNLVLLLSSSPVLGLGYLIRRRKAALAA